MSQFDSKPYTTKLFAGKLYGGAESAAGSVSANLFGSGSMTGMALGVVTNSVGTASYNKHHQIIHDDDEVLYLVTAAFLKIAA